MSELQDARNKLYTGIKTNILMNGILGSQMHWSIGGVYLVDTPNSVLDSATTVLLSEYELVSFGSNEVAYGEGANNPSTR